MMQFGLFGSAAARRGGSEFDSSEGFHDFIEYNTKADKEAALERRLQNRMRQLHLATRPDGTVHGGPDRATDDPRVVNEISAMYGSPDEVAQQLEVLRDAGVRYVLLNGGGSGGGARGRESLRRFARDIMPLFAEAAPQRVAGCAGAVSSRMRYP